MVRFRNHWEVEMSNEKKLDGRTEREARRMQLAKDGANPHTLAALAMAEESAALHAESSDREDSLREKAEAEAFGARFHRLLLAAMKSGSTNVVDMLGAAMEAAGVGSVNRDTGVVSGPCAVGETLRDAVPPKAHDFLNLVTDAGKAEAFMTDNPREKWPVVVKAQTLAGARRALDNLERAEKSEPAPPAYSVEERKARAKVADRLGRILYPNSTADVPDLETMLREVERRTGPVASAIRDAALDEADRVVAHAQFAHDIGAPSVEWSAGSNAARDAIRALKSKPAPVTEKPPTPCDDKWCTRYAHGDDLPHIYGKPAPQPSGNPGEFE